MPAECARACAVQEGGTAAAIAVRHGAAEAPGVVAGPAEVLGLHPACRFPPVPPSCPTPQLLEDHLIDARKQACARSVPVIQRPPANLRVETLDQVSGTAVATLLPAYFVDLAQERPHVLARRLEQQLRAVTAHVLSQQVKAVGHSREAGFLAG